jgi:hypothetical protein
MHGLQRTVLSVLSARPSREVQKLPIPSAKRIGAAASSAVVFAGKTNPVGLPVHAYSVVKAILSLMLMRLGAAESEPVYRATILKVLSVDSTV